MQFHFEPNLDFQNAAREAVLRLFEGQPDPSAGGALGKNENTELDAEKLYENAAKMLEETKTSVTSCKELDFSIEMETGVGKTYVYLRTIYDLYTQHQLKKFIIIIPSIAVREGVMKALEQTGHHLASLYQGTRAEVRQYSGAKPNTVRDFCESSQLSILVMNTQAFHDDKNIINDESRDHGYLLAGIQAVRPVLILDEPQVGMDTPRMQERLKNFHPLLKLRYSATHRVRKNLIHRLTPYQAYSQGLVKQVAVYGVREENTQSSAPILFEEGIFSQAAPRARLRINKADRGGRVKENAPVTVSSGDDLERKSGGLPQYRGWRVMDIRKELASGEVKILFTNGCVLLEKHSSSPQKEEIFKMQIGQAIKQHFRAKDMLRPRGIKPLALFFIDRVPHYTDEDGLIRRLFVAQYQAVHRQHYGGPPPSMNVHNGYFAKNKDSYMVRQSAMSENKEVYALIMRDKERLLSFEEPLEFIFSHSALGVGWDNPNVFTLCTLNETKSEIKKHQEIGRGLRLPVTQEGLRWRDAQDAKEDERLNTLTVVVNESYREFVDTYQQELLDDYGSESAGQPFRDAKNPQKLRLNRDKITADDFKKLWRKMAKKTRWLSFFDEEQLTKKCILALKAIRTQPQQIITEAGRIRSFRADGSAEIIYLGRSTPFTLEQPKLSKHKLAKEFAKITNLGGRTAVNVLNALTPTHAKMIQQNPQQFLSEAAERIRPVLLGELVRVVRYEETGEQWPLERFEDLEIQGDNVIPTPQRGVYDAVHYESDIEKRFAELLDTNDKVRVFVKLPSWYAIQTPAGPYHPDFALVIESRPLNQEKHSCQHFFYVIETKGSTNLDDLRESEVQKINCAIRHFKAIGFKHYLAPVTDRESFNARATEKNNTQEGNLA